MVGRVGEGENQANLFELFDISSSLVCADNCHIKILDAVTIILDSMVVVTS
jgi:hypothetical protein